MQIQRLVSRTNQWNTNSISENAHVRSQGLLLKQSMMFCTQENAFINLSRLSSGTVDLFRVVMPFTITTVECTELWTRNALVLVQIPGSPWGIIYPCWFILAAPSGTRLFFTSTSTLTLKKVGLQRQRSLTIIHYDLVFCTFSGLSLLLSKERRMLCCICCLQRQSQSVALASREADFVSGNIGLNYKSALCRIPSLALSFALKTNLTDLWSHWWKESV